jgi:hypothetical protein
LESRDRRDVREGLHDAALATVALGMTRCFGNAPTLGASDSKNEEAAMVSDDFRPIKYVARRAYELALTGDHEDFASIEAAIVDEGYAGYVGWLKVPCVMAALGEICFASQWQYAT